MTGDVRFSWPSDRGRLRRLVEPLVGRCVTILGRACFSALSLMYHRPSRSAPFTTVRVAPEFSPRDYPATFAALQAPTGSKLLDLVPARLLCADLFDELAGAWAAGRETVPRLAILLSFERWVMLREAALAQLQPLAARGVRVELFYAEQSSAGYLDEWFTRGLITHDVLAVVVALSKRHPSAANRKAVIDALAWLARAHAPAHDLPALLTEIAALSMTCGGAVEAEALTREALRYVPELPSAMRGQLLRELGAALLCQGKTEAAMEFFDQAFTMAMNAGAPDIGASALYHSGLCALLRGDYPAAERQLRHAIDLLPRPSRRPHLLAQAHSSLAVALMHQGLPDAEHHAQTALALRSDPNSQQAVEDRRLLAKLRAPRRDFPGRERSDASAEHDRVPIGPLPREPRDAPEPDV